MASKKPSLLTTANTHTPAEQPKQISLRRRVVKTAVGNIPHKYLYEWRTRGNNWYLINDKNIYPIKRNPKGFAEARRLEQKVIDGETVTCSAVYRDKKLFIGENKNV